ncbi:hypothetical protein [Krasilnikovia cinnamomea]|uniref:hypothetical protein n=1 Tax=Krasilnikovia cinnamomea TaxID=349313 RepID=UPI00102C8297|nr:hypothetical protein [Krasilnikovia cinnamomea]
MPDGGCDGAVGVVDGDEPAVVWPLGRGGADVGATVVGAALVGVDDGSDGAGVTVALVGRGGVGGWCSTPGVGSGRTSRYVMSAATNTSAASTVEMRTRAMTARMVMVW